MVSDIRIYRVFRALGALVVTGALALACAPFSESRGDAPPVDPRRSDDPTVPLKATFDSGTTPGDGGVVSTADGATPSAGCAGAADCERVVFVTSESVYGGVIFGVSGANAICNRLAAASGHPRVAGRTFEAWLSDDTQSPSTSFVRGTKAYVRPDGVRIAVDYAQLTSGAALENAIEVDETGRTQGGSVWSATAASGQHDGASCFGWSSAYGAGAKGSITEKAERWTWDYGTDRSSGVDTSDCSDDHRIYCFEQ